MPMCGLSLRRLDLGGKQMGMYVSSMRRALTHQQPPAGIVKVLKVLSDKLTGRSVAASQQ